MKLTASESSKAAKNPDGSNDASGVFDSDGSEQNGSTATGSGETDSDGDIVVPVDAGSKANGGTPEDLIDILQNIGEGKEAAVGDAVAFDEEEGRSRGIPGAGGIGIIQPTSSAMALSSSLGAVMMYALGSIFAF